MRVMVLVCTREMAGRGRNLRGAPKSHSNEGLVACLERDETSDIARSAVQVQGSAAGPVAWDRDAELTLLFDRYRSGVFAYCRRHLGSDEDADDAVQTTFIHALRSLRNGVRPQLEVPWLLAIARNVCRERWRTTYRRRSFEVARDFEELTDVQSSSATRREELFGLDDALSHLTDQQRRAVLLRDWRGLTYTEIAEQLELSEAAVETVLFRARRALATELEHGPRERGLRRRLRPLLTPLQWLWRVGAGGKLAAGTAAVSVAVIAAGTAPPSATAPAPVKRAVAGSPVEAVLATPATEHRWRLALERRPRSAVHVPAAVHVARVAAPTRPTPAEPVALPAAASTPKPVDTSPQSAGGGPANTPVAAEPSPLPPSVTQPVASAAVPPVEAQVPPVEAQVPPITLQTPAVQLPQPLPSVPPLTVQTPAIQATVPATTLQVTVPPLPGVPLPPVLP